ncbi:hypothetical protein QF036_003153 [Arthrobacter globiformis]|nr:hypothetical protein [Arthrobacter globiformis]
MVAAALRSGQQVRHETVKAPDTTAAINLDVDTFHSRISNAAFQRRLSLRPTGFVPPFRPKGCLVSIKGTRPSDVVNKSETRQSRRLYVDAIFETRV